MNFIKGAGEWQALTWPRLCFGVRVEFQNNCSLIS